MEKAFKIHRFVCKHGAAPRKIGMYVTGAGYYLGWIIYNIDGAIFSRTDVPTVYYICGTLMTYPFYIASVIIGSKIGFNSAYNSLPKED